MSVDSLISVEHTPCMHARMQNILSEGVVREDRNATKNRPPSTHQRNTIEMAFCWRVDNGPLGSFVIFRGSGAILLGNPIFLWFFTGVRTPVPPLDPPIACIWKKVLCLKCSFQGVVIIGNKARLDYNSWYACLLLIRHVGRSSGFKLFANFDSRS